jgi:medium-chain acyl-[acyl-carrier-protein] hydrolase
VSIFREWPRNLPDDVEVCSLELPGRDTLISRPAIRHLPELVDHLSGGFAALTSLPYVLFGHSLGALIAFELARRLRRDRLPLPEALCVSGHRAPHLPDPRRPLHALPDPQFAAELDRLQGTPPEVLAHRELMDLFLPLLRADFTLAETYRYTPERPLPMPLLAWGGADDAEVSREEVAAWEQHTSVFFRLRLLPGSHFFVHSAVDLLTRSLAGELQDLGRRSGTPSSPGAAGAVAVPGPTGATPPR